MFNSNQAEIFEKPSTQKNDIETLLKTSLPPLPGSVFRILELLRDPNVTTNALATAVGYDPLLAARLLRLANSSYYSRQRNVTTIHKAIDTIGTKALYDAVMLGVAANTFSKEIEGSTVGRAIWEHSIAVALLSREISQIMDLQGTENAFICGLLHDIGKFILLKADVKCFTALSQRIEEDEMMMSEERHFGVNHTEVGVLMARRWGLPDEISSAILHHHNPTRASQAIVIAHIINASDLIAGANGYGLCSEEELGYIQSESTIVLRLTQPQMLEAWENVQSNLQEIVGTLSGR